MRGVAHDPVLRAKLMALHEEGIPLTSLSADHQIPRRVLSRWWARYQVGDWAALQPRSRRPHHSPTRVTATHERQVLQLRASRWGPARIAPAVGLGHGTVQRILERHRRNRLDRPARRQRVQRYEKSRPGELVHIDFKYLPVLQNRAEFEFAAVDDYTREAVTWIAPMRSSVAATTFLEQVLAALPYHVEAVMTDNDMIFTMRYAYYGDRLTRFEQALQSLGIAHRRCQPRAPESNGKVERFIKTVDDECFAVVRPRSLVRRAHALEAFMEYYNQERAHQSLDGLTPVARRQAFFRQR